MNKSQDLYKRAKKIIPGATQLLSKRAELFLPQLWPSYYQKAKGCVVWDLDGRKYIDLSYMGIGCCILGYADPEVDTAVKKVVNHGQMSTLNCPEEVRLAERLCAIHPWAKMARFARTGAEAAAIAIRIARAKTQKERILFCGYHGWHDWYLAANIAHRRSLDGHLLPGLKPRGVPHSLKGSAIPFNYNDTKGFLQLVKQNKHKIAAVIMEPLRNYYPQEGFLQVIREVTRQQGIALIFDEITSGWRLNFGGAHLQFKVYPDIAVFAKGLSNGYPMAAVIGRKEIMQAAQETFISSTYWTERIGPTAALATIGKLKRKHVAEYLNGIGRLVQEGWKKQARRHNLDIRVCGIYPLSHFSFQYRRPLVLKTLFTQEMLKRGFLASTAFYASYAHKRAHHIEEYLQAVEETFAFIARAIKKNRPERYLKGPVCQAGFKRLT